MSLNLIEALETFIRDPINEENKFISLLRDTNIQPSMRIIITMSLGDSFINNKMMIRDILCSSEIPILLLKQEDEPIFLELIKRLLLSFREEGDLRIFEYILKHKELIIDTFEEDSSYRSQCLPLIMIELHRKLLLKSENIFSIVNSFANLFPIPTLISLYSIIIDNNITPLFPILFTKNLKNPPEILIKIERSFLFDALLSGKIIYPEGLLILRSRYPQLQFI